MEGESFASFLNENEYDADTIKAAPPGFEGWVWSADDGMFTKDGFEVSYDERDGVWGADEGF